MALAAAGSEVSVDERRIQEVIAFLEQEVPRDRARVKLAQYGGSPDESQIVANETGFLRLGVEFLKAAYAPIVDRSGSAAVKVDIDYLLTRDSSIQFDWVERREPVEEQFASPGRLVPVLLLSILAVGVVLAVVGLLAVLRWLAA
jgi:hypothetical protein